MVRLMLFILLCPALSYPLVNPADAQEAKKVIPSAQGLSPEQVVQRSEAWPSPARFTTVISKLDDSGGTEAIVYQTGTAWCGTGGCPTYILRQTGATWEIVSRTLATRPPIYILNNVSNGWHSIGV